ncbi:MAG: hypothetical protein K0S55_55 [Clostridia bacterium]|nr:hypothetical protein [Clostridia bacterium]
MNDRLIYNLKTTKYPGGTRWLYFYIFIRFPISFILGGLSLLSSLATDLNSISILTDFSSVIIYIIIFFIFYIPSIFSYIFSFFVYRKMKNLEKSSYKLNMILLAIDWFIFGIKMGINFIYLNIFIGFFPGLIIFGLIWFLPNFIYFKNRKCLFTDNTSVKHNSSINILPVNTINEGIQYCRICGVVLSRKHKFCNKCGTAVIK